MNANPKRNRVRCKRCDTVIESKHRHDFVTCKCGDISVDGGQSYSKRAFRPGAEWEELGDNVERLATVIRNAREDGEK